jgi:hypothetical protein
MKAFYACTYVHAQKFKHTAVRLVSNLSGTAVAGINLSIRSLLLKRHKTSMKVYPNIPDWCRHLYSSCGSTKHQ